MQVSPWSTEVSISWRTTLRFYERRYKIMRRIEDELGIAAYRHEHDSVAARLPEHAGEIELRPDGLIARRLLPEGGNPAEVKRAIEIVLTSMEVTPVVADQAAFKHVLGLGDDFSEVLTESLPKVLPSWASGVGLTDASILYDGVWNGTVYQAEFGIAASGELMARLSGMVSRIAQQPLPWPDYLEGLPGSSLFVESRWFLNYSAAADGWAAIENVYEDALQSSNQVVDRLFEAVAPGRRGNSDHSASG